MNEQSQHPVSAGWGTIVLIYLICVFGASSISQVVPVVADVGRQFHAFQQVSWIISIPSALVAVGALLTGWLVDRVGDKPLILLGSLLLVIGDVGVTMATTLNPLLLMRVIEGIGYDLVSVATVTMMARLTLGRRRTIALTLWSSFIPMSFAIFLALAGVLAGHWQWAFSGHAAATAVLGLLAFSLPTRDEAPGKGRSTGLALVLRTPACWALGVAFAAAAFMQTGIVSTLPTMLEARYHLSVQAASSVVVVGMLFNVAGSLLMGPLLNSKASRMLLALGGAFAATVAGAAIYIPGLTTTAVVAIAWLYFLSAGLIVGLWALLPAIAPTPNSRGAASGLVTQLTLFGVLFGPPGAFMAGAVAGSPAEVRNIAIAMALCAALLWVVAKRASANADAVGAGGGH